MTDRLTIRGLRCFGRHGVFEHERATGQPFVVDLTLGVQTASAAHSDDLEDAVDYGRLVEAVTDVVSGESVALIETLAQRIADVCLRRGQVEWVDVCVHKPRAPVAAEVDDVAVTIRRTQPAEPDTGPDRSAQDGEP